MVGAVVVDLVFRHFSLVGERENGEAKSATNAVTSQAIGHRNRRWRRKLALASCRLAGLAFKRAAVPLKHSPHNRCNREEIFPLQGRNVYGSIAFLQRSFEPPKNSTHRYGTVKDMVKNLDTNTTLFTEKWLNMIKSAARPCS